MNFKIKEARERIGLSQKELAISLGIKPTTFNGYENGTHDPKSDILSMIAQKCETTVDYLLGLTDNPEKINRNIIGISDDNKQQLLHNYNALNENAQNQLIDYSNFLVSKQDNLKNNERKVKVIRVARSANSKVTEIESDISDLLNAPETDEDL